MPTQQQPSQEASSTGKRLALVVGNNGKPQPGRDALKYATQSAKTIAEVLQDRCSFELLQPSLLDEQATTEKLRKAIYTFVKNRGPDDFLLFYFCGHGEPLFIETEQRDVYLVTEDFEPEEVEKIEKDTHISFSWLSRVLYEKTDAGTVLVMLDCCYAGNAGYQQEEQPLEALKQSIQKCFDSYLGKAENSRGVRITIAATSYNGTTFEQDGYSVLACYLLRVLGTEECVEVVNERGEITFERLVDYLRDHLPQQPSISNKPISAPVILATFPDQTAQARHARQQAEQQAAQEQKSRTLSNHEFSRFLLRDRLESFRGRVTELNEIRQYITTMCKTGGYVALTGEAGQGKSSIIAKLVDLHRIEQDEQREELVIYHFIPFDAGTDYQVVLLKHLMARLILKYHLPTFYVEGDHLPTLRSLFPSLLKEVIAKGGQEIIFIDGLDQLQEDSTGVRDSNFLPSTAPPEGVVFVIGTRPNALRQLKRHTPFAEYPLQPLSQDDFKLILRHRGVPLESHHIAILYSKLEANALFLDLAAKELAEHHTLTVDEIIQRISDNPENLFSLTLERLGRNQSTLDTLWKRVIKPVLGVLLVAHEPIERTHLKQIINLKHTHDAHSSIDSEELERGLERLGGLVIKDIRDGLQCYSLFHLKFRDYLRRDEDKPDKDYIFAADDEQHWHSILATWCEHPQLDCIWQDTPQDASEQRRRLYARQYYITHLYYAGSWQRLFQLIDEFTYGRAKVQFDVSGHAYSLDLELGQKAIASGKWSKEEAIEQLPRLWRYTLLVCSLASKADNYPRAAFELMLLLGQETKALGLAELLTNPKYKAEIFLLIATHLTTLPDREIQCQQLFIRTQQIALAIPDSGEQAEALSKLGRVLAEAQRWEQAEQVIGCIQDSDEQAKALSELGQALAQTQQWQEAEQVIGSIQDSREQAKALSGLGQALAQVGRWEQAQQVWQQAEQVIDTIRGSREKAEALSELGLTLAQAHCWEQAKQVWEEAEQVVGTIQRSFEQGVALSRLGRALAQVGRWEEAEQVIGTIEDSLEQAEALSELGQALVKAHQWKRAEQIWEEAEQVVGTIQRSFEQGVALSRLGQALAQVGRWEQAEQVISSIEDSLEQAEALRELGRALAQARRWEQAEQVIGSIQDSREQARALRELGRALGQAQRWEEAKQVWEQAEQVIGTIQRSYRQAAALNGLGQALAQVGRWEQAEQVIGTIEDSREQAAALSGLGRTLAQAHCWEQAKQVWEEAEQVIGTIEDSRKQARALSGLGRTLAQARRWEQAEQVIGTIRGSREKAEALSELGRTLAQAHCWEQAEQVWEQAKQVIGTIEDSREKTRALSELGRVLARVGRWEQAEQVIGTIEDSREKARALSELGRTLGQAHEDSDKQARALSESGRALAQARRWEEAEQVIGSIQDSREQARALSGLGRALAQAQRWEEAEQVWEEAEQIIGTIQNSTEQAEALSELGDALARSKEYERLLYLVHYWWQRVRRRDEAINLLPLAYGFLSSHPELGLAFCDAFAWVDEFLRG